jgi:putative oxidoreductase
MLAAGLFTRFVAAQVIGFMAVAAFKVHWGAGFFWNKGGYEYPLFWGLMALAILIRGGGALSLDFRIGKEL